MFLSTETVMNYLPAYGYQKQDGDDLFMRHAIERVMMRIRTYTNQPCVPKELKLEAINMAIGEFLFIKKSTGHLLDGENGIVFPNVIKQFTEGDTNVSANAKGKDDEANFNKWVDQLRMGDPFVLEHFRRLHW